MTGSSAVRLRDRPGLGLAFALLLLAAVEAVLHTDAFLVRYRSVFAAGRAMDKVRYVESHPPALLIVGNSRVDNGFDPQALAERLGKAQRNHIFNLGLPGSDARTLFGLLTRFDRKKLLGPGAWVNWALPLGISFYTFHMLSAMIDVYRGDWATPVSFKTWCLYVTYFPHLIAGAILRPGQLIDQLRELRPLAIEEMRVGAAIFAGGLIKKGLREIVWVT